MARTTANAGVKASARRLPSEKGTELFGIVLLLAALILGASLVTYHPDDASFLTQTSEETPIGNWVGPFGAQLAAMGFGFLGLSALLLPLLLLMAGWRRVRHLAGNRVVGRGLGAVLVLLALPGLLHLPLQRVAWRGVEIQAGGFAGTLLGGWLERGMGFAGALFVLLGAVIIGFVLLIQSTLGELLAGWRRGLLEVWNKVGLAWSRRRHRHRKDRDRRRVVTKHLERARREAEGRAEERNGPAAADLPLHVVEKPGRGGFSLRRVTVEERQLAEPAVAAAPRPTPAPQQIAFAAGGAAALPPVNLLGLEGPETQIDENELVRLGDVIRRRCAEFGVDGSVEGISPGPVITVFEFQPAPGVKVSQIVNLQDDLALALKAESVRIDRIPGRSTLGIEVPNPQRSTIRLGSLISREAFRHSRSPLTVALGTDIRGEPYFADLATMPHLLVAGATGAGKSVGLQSMITSILYKATRNEVQFIFIDPKRIELGAYADIPHLKAEVVVEPRKAANALRWTVAEMERRYRLLAELHVRSIDFYNRAIRDPKVRQRLALSEGEAPLVDKDLTPLPYYVVVIDELADLMLLSSAEVESSIARLAQMARAVGIHLVVATQRPSVDVLTGTIKANFPCRLSYATASRHDSRTILDQVGAEKLLGKGDMLFMPAGTSRVQRLHGAYVSEQETASLVRWLKKRGGQELDPTVLAPPEEERSGRGGGDDDDELFEEAARLVVAEQQGSASFLQRRLRVGFSRAARLIDIMERDGLLGPPQGSKPRDVLVKADYFEEIDRARAETEA